ncbi:bifunctional 2-polyprenyl-6-hydroxyphenol methylase/3-demethylubiquinol 3-O-methyltransferase UbiG [Flavobacterium sp. J27]|uniref:class I SAM-dependent methyltransferase n=1 Tax=Flavobacterium sp. J27 TaxID=2060419 RepID=UPI0010302B3A|nr:class I SAM-dependent methyltransferase [Flavobacterium sp. J27]
MNYEEKDKQYYSNIRLDLVSLINLDNKNLKILEIGAAYGETLNFLKEKGIASEVIGIDLFEDVKNKQNYKELDRFIFGNIEYLDLEEYNDYFDIILFPDVLEHLIEPKKTLQKAHKLLKTNGKIIVSMPNIRHYSALVKIFLKGDFRYEGSGIFDYTHMRFYCKKNIVELISISGYKIEKAQSSILHYNGFSITRIINLITLRLFEEFFSYQYFFVATKNEKN